LIAVVIRILSSSKNDSIIITCLKLIEVCIPQEDTINVLFSLGYINIVSPLVVNYSSETRLMALKSIYLILNTKTISNSIFSSKLLENFVSLAVHSVDMEESSMALNILTILSKDEEICKTILEYGVVKHLLQKLPSSGEPSSYNTVSILEFFVSLSTIDIARSLIMNDNGYQIILNLLQDSKVDVQIKACAVIANFVSDEDFTDFVINNRTADFIVKLLSNTLDVPVLTAGIKILIAYSKSNELMKTIKTADPKLVFLQKLTKHYDPKIRTIAQNWLYETLIN